MTAYRVAVADGALTGQDALAERYAGVTEFCSGDVSSPATLARLTAGADALIVSLQRLTAQHMDALPESVRVIGRAGVGLDNIDLAAAARRDIRVVFEPGYATEEVADHAVAMLLAAQRRIVQADRRTRAEGWLGGAQLGRVCALSEATAAVLGAGRIGRAVIHRLRPFVREVLAFDVAADPLDQATLSTDLTGVLAAAQVVTVHLPLSPATYHLIGADEIAAMPAGAVLVNVSRGGLVDESALAAALHSGHLSAAALDVFETEPLPADSPLRGAPNLVLSPHVAWYSDRSAPRLADWTVEDVLAALAGDQLRHGAFATASLPPNSGTRAV